VKERAGVRPRILVIKTLSLISCDWTTLEQSVGGLGAAAAGGGGPALRLGRDRRAEMSRSGVLCIYNLLARKARPPAWPRGSERQGRGEGAV
jgi:hypothetical protein